MPNQGTIVESEMSAVRQVPIANYPRHPLGTRANILLSSVFGPYAQDDEYGSRKMNPMELYHNQVTRVQGPFSLRMFHRSFGLMLIQANLEAPCSLLDFPTRERFIEEIQTQKYDIVGISSIVPNLGKVKEMCKLVRQYQPNATIVVGGHIANKPDIERLIDADHIVKGDGVRWFRKYLSQDEHAPVKHPLASSAHGTRTMGLRVQKKRGDIAAIVLPSAGCPVGCNFCATSAMFGGKGKFVNFYETGDELFRIICQLEEKLNVQSFFIMDENFLLHRARALRLLELMEEHGKSWAFYVFSSGRVLRSYTIEQLVSLGISWVWMGLEGRDSQYAKLSNVDTRELVRDLQSHGIRVLGSTIIGLEDHKPECFDEIIDWAVSHDTDFHQFMLYTPVPGTAFYEEHRRQGTLLSDSECDTADVHGQYRFNYRHAHIPPGEETNFLLKAFERDFEENGPSVARLIRTTLQGWKRYKHHASGRIRRRYEWEVRHLADLHAASIWAMEKWYRKNAHIREKMASLLRDISKEFGWKTKVIAPLVGRVILSAIKRETKRLAKGWTYEPPVIYEKNAQAWIREKLDQTTLKIKAVKIVSVSAA